MKKKLLFILSFIIAFVCIFTLSQGAEEASVFSLPVANAATVAEGTCGDDLTWTLDDSGVLTISGSGVMYDISASTAVPWYNYKDNIVEAVVEDGVTTLEFCAFYYCEKLERVTLPDGLIEIGGSVFVNCLLLKEVYIPQSVQTIGDKVFEGTNALEKIEVAAGNENYASVDGVLFDKEITNLITYPAGKTETDYVLPETTKNISAYAFHGCVYLETISFCEGLETIGNFAFYECRGLFEIELPDTVTDVGQNAFCDCTSLTRIEFSSSMTVVNVRILLFCESLVSVVLPEGIETIEVSAFGSCTALTEITLPSTLSSVEVSAFDDCTSLESITVAEENLGFSSLDGVLYSKDGATLILYPDGKQETYFAVPDTVTTLGEETFAYNQNLITINLPDSLSTINSDVFLACASLTNISVGAENESFTSVSGVLYTKDGTGIVVYPTAKKDKIFCIPEGVSVINAAAFYGNGNLERVYFPVSLTKINYRAFYQNTALSSVVLPPNVTDIGYAAFGKCTSLKEVTVLRSDCDIVRLPGLDTFPSEGVLFKGYDNSTIHEFASRNDCEFLPIVSDGVCGDNLLWTLDMNMHLTISGTGKMTNYSNNTQPWNAYINQIKTIRVEYGVESISKYAFYKSTSLEQVYVSESITDIGLDSFAYCTALTGVEFAEGTKLEYVRMFAFAYCSALRSISLPADYSVGARIFYDCTALEEIALPDKRLYISGDMCENTAYYNNEDNWENGVLYIGAHLIAAKTDIEGVCTVKDGTKSIASSAFRGCSELNELVLADSVEIVETLAFQDCSSLKKITLSKNLLNIQAQSFSGCDALEEIYCSVESENYATVDGVLYNKDITSLVKYPLGKKDEVFNIPEGIKNIRGYAFRGCLFLKEIKVPESLTEIGDSVMYDCNQLEHIVLPETIGKIDDFAFHFCEALTDIVIFNKDCEIYDDDMVIPANATIIAYEGSTAQAYAEKYNRSFIAINDNLQSPADWRFEDGVLTVNCSCIPELKENEVFLWYCYSWMTDAIVLDGVTEVSENAFKNFSDSTVVVINGQNIEIKDGAFADSHSLMSVISACDITVNKQAFGSEKYGVKLFVAEDYSYTGDFSIIRFTKEEDIVKFDRDITVTYYDFFNIISAICHIYEKASGVEQDSQIMKLYFPSFNTVDFGFEYKRQEQELIPVTSYSDIFVFPVVDVNYESMEISYNELCEQMAAGTIEKFILVATDGGYYFGNAEVDNTPQESGILAGVQRILRAIITFFNKILRLFR